MSMPVDMLFRLLEWSLGNDTGLSSRTMAKAAIHKTNGCVPGDPADFGRCHRLMKAVPELRSYFPQIAQNCPRFKLYLDNWDELTAMYERSLAGGTGKAPELYARMKELDKATLLAESNTKTDRDMTRNYAEA